MYSCESILTMPFQIFTFVSQKLLCPGLADSSIVHDCILVQLLNIKEFFIPVFIPLYAL